MARKNLTGFSLRMFSDVTLNQPLKLSMTKYPVVKADGGDTAYQSQSGYFMKTFNSAVSLECSSHSLEFRLQFSLTWFYAAECLRIQTSVKVKASLFILQVSLL